MTSTLCSAPRCSFPALNGFLCRNCADTLKRDLSAIPWLLEDLEVTTTRQDRIADPDGRSGDERPLPIRLHAMEARRDLNVTLASWTMHIAGRLEGLTGGGWDELRLADYLLDHLGTILTDPAAGQIADEIGYARGVCVRAIDKPVPRVYVGPCEDCDKDLYAHPSAAEVECKTPDCGAVYPIEARRRWLLGKAEDHLLTAPEISRALPGLLGRAVDVDKLKGLLRRRRDSVTQHPPLKRNGPPLYRVGDIIRMYHDIAQEEAERRPRKIAS